MSDAAHRPRSTPVSGAARAARDAAVLGVILAGGGSTRFGAPKALAEVGGVAILERVRRALSEAVEDVFLVANDAAAYAHFGLETRPDRIAGVGALGGIHAAAAWARELGARGALCVACDMPFVPAALLARLAELGAAADVAAPESGGRRGVEPLCAYYGTGCVDAIEAELARGERHVIGFYDDVDVARLPLADVRRFGDPATLFMNVNTRDELVLAESLAAGTERR
jgi:molybdopterin-guanine dinucleotide biosynthesis protein A